MIEKYGQAFKELRESKNVSTRFLSELSEKSNSSRKISASNISKFEREETNIGFPKIVNLLNVLNIPINEYILKVEELKDSVMDDFNGINEAFRKNDISRLQFLEDRYLASKEELIRNEHLSVLCHALKKRLTKEPVETAKIEVIQHYLFSIDNWQYYEVALFTNIIFIFDGEVIGLLAKKAVKVLNNYNQISRYSDEMVLMLMNVVVVMLEKRQLDLVRTYIFKIEDYLSGSRYIYERIKCSFLNGCCYYLTGDKDKGEKLAEAAVRNMELFELENEAKAHKIYFEELKKND